MSKRYIAVLVLVVLFALSVVVFGVAPTRTETVSSSENTFASLRIEQGSTVRPPECPAPGLPGCGGG